MTWSSVLARRSQRRATHERAEQDRASGHRIYPRNRAVIIGMCDAFSSGDGHQRLRAPADGCGKSFCPQDPSRVALGRLLFHDPRLSKGREVSCNSCHVLTRFGIDGKATSTFQGEQGGRRNVPSVFNAATHVAQFWDGRALTVETQASQAITNPVEMAMPNEEAVVDALSHVPQYVQMFHAAFPADQQPISLRNAGEAIGAFERGLVTKSRWDSFIAGNHAALTAREKQGFDVFMQRGCIVCHAGPQVAEPAYKGWARCIRGRIRRTRAASKSPILSWIEWCSRCPL